MPNVWVKIISNAQRSGETNGGKCVPVEPGPPINLFSFPENRPVKSYLILPGYEGLLDWPNGNFPHSPMRGGVYHDECELLGPDECARLDEAHSIPNCEGFFDA